MVKKYLVLFCSIVCCLFFIPGAEVSADNGRDAEIAEKKVSQYLETSVDSRLRIRSGPGVGYEIIRTIPSGVVLKVKKMVKIGEDEVWYQVDIDKAELRYPERVTSDWYFAGKYNGEDYVVQAPIRDDLTTINPYATAKDKKVKVFLSERKIEAYEKGQKVFEAPISSGKSVDKEGNPTDKYKTPTGTFNIYKKVVSAYMQGPLPGDDESYDLPGVSWAMYFTYAGNVIHAAYWNPLIGKEDRSHGCVNMRSEDAQWLYNWAPIGTVVTVVK